MIGNIVLGLVLMGLFGYIGVALASVVSCFISIYLQQRDVCKVFEIRQRELLPYRSILMTFGTSGFTAGVVYLIISFLPGHQFIQFFSGGIITMLLCIGLALARKEVSIPFLFNKPIVLKARR